MRFELFIATRYLRAKRRQAVVGIITAISVVGVAAGVASLIIALAITTGMRKELQARLLGSTSHVNLVHAEGGIRDWQTVLSRLQAQPHIVAAAPALYGEVLISRGSHAGGAVVKGILPDYEKRVSDLLQNLFSGSAEPLKPDPQAGQFNPPPPIVLGKDVADNLGANVNSVVTVTSPQGELTPLGIVPKYQKFRVVGIFKSGFYEYDHAWAFARLQDIQLLFGEPDLVSVLEFKIDDLNQAPEVGEQLQRVAGPGFDATNWQEQNQALFSALRTEQIVTFIVIALIVCVAALNILISLTMMVMEKTKDIAVLMSMGVKRRQVRRIFIFQGLLIGVIGTALGLVLGYAISYVCGHYRLISLSAEVYSIDYLPFAPSAIDGLVVGTVSLCISLLATIYPSWSASRVLPAEALRYE